MTTQDKIWKLLREHKTLLLKKLNIPKIKYINYISALKKGKYIKVKVGKGSGSPITEIILIRNTGEKTPLFNKGLLIDYNIGEEIKINKDINKRSSKQKILKDVLETILEMQSEIILLSELAKKAKVKVKVKM